MEVRILIGALAVVAGLYLLRVHFCRAKEQNYQEKALSNRKELAEPQIIHNDVQEWIEKEKPYQHMTDDDKDLLRTIGTNINKAARNGEENNATRIYDRLIRNNVLKEKLVVYRGVVNQDHERRLAKEQGLSNEYLYNNGYIFCSLNAGTYYWNSRKTRMIISLPAGTHYLYTGEYSNTPESNEIILGKNSILRIDNEKDCNGEHYMWLTLCEKDR